MLSQSCCCQVTVADFETKGTAGAAGFADDSVVAEVIEAAKESLPGIVAAAVAATFVATASEAVAQRDLMTVVSVALGTVAVAVVSVIGFVVTTAVGSVVVVFEAAVSARD